MLFDKKTKKKDGQFKLLSYFFNQNFDFQYFT